MNLSARMMKSAVAPMVPARSPVTTNMKHQKPTKADQTNASAIMGEL